MTKINPSKITQRLRGFGALWGRRTEVGGMLRDSFRGNYKMALLTKIALLLSLLYVVSPFDIVPDWILFLGWTDDLAVLYFLSGRILSETDRWKKGRTFPLKDYRSS